MIKKPRDNSKTNLPAWRIFSLLTKTGNCEHQLMIHSVERFCGSNARENGAGARKWWCGLDAMIIF